MTVTVRIPTQLRPLTRGASEVTAEGDTVAALVDDLDRRYAGLRDRLLDASGVRRFTNLFVGEEDVRHLDGLATALRYGDTVVIVPAVAGG